MFVNNCKIRKHNWLKSCWTYKCVRWQRENHWVNITLALYLKAGDNGEIILGQSRSFISLPTHPSPCVKCPWIVLLSSPASEETLFCINFGQNSLICEECFGIVTVIVIIAHGDGALLLLKQITRCLLPRTRTVHCIVSGSIVALRQSARVACWRRGLLMWHIAPVLIHCIRLQKHCRLILPPHD